MNTYSEGSRVNDVNGEKEEGPSDRELLAEVGLDDGETSDEADTPVDDHAEAAEEHCTKAVPVTTYKLTVNEGKAWNKFEWKSLEIEMEVAVAK